MKDLGLMMKDSALGTYDSRFKVRGLGFRTLGLRFQRRRVGDLGFGFTGLAEFRLNAALDKRPKLLSKGLCCIRSFTTNYRFSFCGFY